MARGRMLNKKVCGCKQFDNLPDDTCRLLATWTISQLDVRGVFYADPAMVCSLVFPRRSDVTAEQVAGYLNEMEEQGLIVRFEASNDVWQWWPGFERNQVGLRADREKPDYPAPPSIECPNDYAQDEGGQGDGEARDDARQEDGESAEGGGNKGSEVKSSEAKLSKETPTAGHAPSPPPPRKPRKARKPKTPVPPAVKVFRANAHRYPAKSWYGEVAGLVGEDEQELARWGRVVKAWVGCGWNPTNVKGMLECFREGVIPSTGGKGKSAKSEPAGFSGIRDWLAEEGAEVPA